MVIQTLTGFIYDLTIYAWAFASVVVKYYLAFTAAKLYRGRGLTRESFENKLLEESRIVLTSIVTLGIVLFFLKIQPSPLLKLFSELFALVYLALLFWKY